MADLPMILCTRCDSTVAWGPYCPQCSAYLEFAGQPPWSPDAPTVTDVEVEALDEPGTQDTVEEVVAERVVDVPEEYEAFLRPDESEPSRRVRASTIIEIIGIIAIGAIIVFVAGRLSNWWIAGGLGAVIAGWAALLIAPLVSRRPVPEPAMVVVQEVEPVTEVMIEEVVEVPVPVALEARAPQELPSQVVERTVAVATRTAQGDTPCAVCGQLNESTRHFCDWCGAAMPGAVLQPDFVVVEAEIPESAKHSNPPRRLTRSWRVPILVFSLLGVFLASVMFALFGPNAIRVQFGLTQVYQAIDQFINPRAGNIVVPVSVEASSTLQGTQPISAAGGDARTFWASAPSFGFGVGTTLVFGLPNDEIIDRMVILPGVQGSQFGPRALATPKDIVLFFDDGSTYSTSLLRVNADRDFRQLVEFPRTETRSVTMRIDSVHPPTGEEPQSYGEVAVAGVEFISPPLPPQILKLPTALPSPRPLPGS